LLFRSLHVPTRGEEFFIAAGRIKTVEIDLSIPNIARHRSTTPDHLHLYQERERLALR
jgi:hypothetical protein